jgi:hypothetical protein
MTERNQAGSSGVLPADRCRNRTKDGMFNTITDFTADKFTPTTWEAAKKKAQFAKNFIRFAEADFPRRQFTKSFYHRLALTFGHIAHFDVMLKKPCNPG